MSGSALVTTRLSSDTMNIGTAVTTTAHMGLKRRDIPFRLQERLPAGIRWDSLGFAGIRRDSL
ncbi:hypothetical protein GCM10010273_08590 [Streptomyces lavendulocolor]